MTFTLLYIISRGFLDSKVTHICLYFLLIVSYIHMLSNICMYINICAQLLQSCLTLSNPVDSSLPGSSVHGIFQGKNIGVVACPPPRDLPDPGIELVVSPVSCTSQVDSLLLSHPGSPYISVDGHVGCFYVLAIINSAAMNTEVHISFQLDFSSFLNIRLVMGLLSHKVALLLVF